MKRTLSVMAALSVLVVTALPAMAQRKPLSPHETISLLVDKARVEIVYGRPYTTKPGTTEARKIWGGLVPYGKVWRTGADEATLLALQKDIKIGDTVIPAGAYTLFTLPNEDGTAKLIISKDVGEWGLQYKEADDFARVDLTKATLDTPVNEFTMAIVKNPAGGGIIKMSWENTEYSVAFTVPQ